ncbi:MAG TPA: hypothetical protein VFU74_15100, partial [Actinocrinis sp.]|nr:hypothetical protein [Actinocrinis sp.]
PSGDCPARLGSVDGERAAVDDGRAALDQLLRRLTDVPTPAGPTPRQLDIRAEVTLLPVIVVTQKRRPHTVDRAGSPRTMRTAPASKAHG